VALIISLLLACAGGDPAATPSLGTDTDTDTAAVPPCDAIEGADGVVVVSLSHPEHLVGPASPPVEAGGAASLAGPGPAGQAYLADHGGRLLRSSDGCAWEPVGQLPVGTHEVETDTGGRPLASYVLAELFVSPHSDRIYVHDTNGRVFVTDDEGATYSELPGAVRPSALLVDPVDIDHLRVVGRIDGVDGRFDSTDGGQTWTALSLAPPDDAGSWVAVQTDAWSTLAAYGNDLAVTDDDGATWTTVIDDCDVSSVVFDPDGLSLRCLAFVGDPSAPTPVVTAHRTTDLGATFVDLPVADDAEFRVRGVGYGAGAYVSAGFGLDAALVEVTTATDTVVHSLPSLQGNTKGVVVLGDRAIIATD
jgi:hypothetical protein